MPFGELWIDRPDALERLASLAIDDGSRADVRRFIDTGMVVFEGAVDVALADTIVANTLGIHQNPERYVLKNKGRYVDPFACIGLDTGDRIVDLYAISAAARQAVFSARVAAFLGAIFGEPAIAMQSISFERGSQQGMHQDTAYVVSESPLALAASWMALEDVVEGSGELLYYPGSHRFRHFLFSGVRKSWQRGVDGDEQHRRFLAQLHEQAAERGLKQERFLARKGDVLMWHADLAHGGARIRNEATRRSLVTHYVPASVKPRYRSQLREAYHELPSGNGHFFSSRHYDLRTLEHQQHAKIHYDAGITRARVREDPS